MVCGPVRGNIIRSVGNMGIQKQNTLNKNNPKLIKKIESLPMYGGGHLVNTGHFKDWVIQILKTGTADVLEDYIIEGGKIVRRK